MDTPNSDGRASPNRDDALIDDVLRQVKEAEARVGPLPQRIGQYRILRILAGGGMGVVYLAEQENPRRAVALKVIRSGIASPKALSRFKYEAQVLAKLQHPGIGQIFEAGTDDTGQGEQPYFAMEFIRGPTLREYVGRHELGIRARLRLLASVCDAVQHAHQKGVIHRDLKPANILVDGSGQPKILDFGVARLTDEDVQPAPVQTDAGQLVGTVPYMSPEQVHGDPAELDTRSDVYSLGVVGYEMLAGRLPYRVRGKSAPEAVRAVRDHDPPPLGSISRAFRGDIEAIISKALERDVRRRYQSASDLAADIRRYLSREPVGARPASVRYQVCKFVARHRVPSALAGALVASVIGFAVWMSVLYAETESARAVAVAAQAEAAAEAERAERERDNALAVRGFLEETLAWTDPYSGRAQLGTFRGMFDDAAGRLEAGFEAQPEVRARIHDVLGLAYASHGLCKSAEHHLRQALVIRQALFGAQSLIVAESLEHLSFHLSLYRRLCNPYRDPHEYAEAIGQCGKALAIRRALQGERDERTLRTWAHLEYLHHLAGDLETADEIMITVSVATAENHWGAETVDELTELARTVVRTWYPADELSPADESPPGLTIAPPGSVHRVATTRALLHAGLRFVRQLWQSGRHETARRLIRMCREPFLADPRLSKSVPWTMTVFAERRMLYGDYDTAEPVLYEAIEASKARFGDGAHFYVAWNLENLALTRQARGDLAAAETGLRAALATRREGLGDKHPTVAVVLERLASVLMEQARFDEARRMLAECRDIRGEALGAADWLTAHTESLLGACLTELGEYEEAEALLVDSYRVIRDDRGERHERTLDALHRIIDLYEVSGESQKAAEHRMLLPAPADPGKRSTP